MAKTLDFLNKETQKYIKKINDGANLTSLISLAACFGSLFFNIKPNNKKNLLLFMSKTTAEILLLSVPCLFHTTSFMKNAEDIGRYRAKERLDNPNLPDDTQNPISFWLII